MDIINKGVSKTLSFLTELMDEFPKWCERTLKKIRKSDAWQLAGILTIIGIGCFITTYVTNLFTIPLGGDFLLQMMPFQYSTYDTWHAFFRTGVFKIYDSDGILGISNIAANSFYYLFDPWMLISLIFPRAWLPQIQGIMTIVKAVTGGVLFYHYLGSFKISVSTRKIGSVCFAFSGWFFFYLWFHFIESFAFFPLVLWGIERVIQKKKPTTLLVGLVLLGVTNYFFFIMMCFGGAFYAIFRVIQTWKKNGTRESFKILSMGIACYAIAILSVASILIPSILNTLDMPRVSSESNLIDYFNNAKGIWEKLKVILAWRDSDSYMTVFPLMSFLFIPIGCFSAPLMPSDYYNNTISSLYVMAPMMLMFLPSVLYSIKTRKWSHLVGVALVVFMLFTPLSYSLFFGMAKEYGRFQIVVVMWMLVYFCISFDKRKEMPRWYMDASALFTAVLYAITIALAFKYTTDTKYEWILNPIDGDRKLVIYLQCAYTFITYIIMRFMFHKTHLSQVLLYLVAFEAVVIGNVTVRVQGVTNNSFQNQSGGLANVAEETKIARLLQDYDDSYYRMYNSSADRGSINLSYREGYNGVGAFHSVYAYNAYDFLNYYSKIWYTTGNWSGGLHLKRNNLETFLGVKYHLEKKSPSNPTWYDLSLSGNIPYGYTDVSTLEDVPSSLKKVLDEGTHALYQNDNFIDTFFVYDSIIDTSSSSVIGRSNNETQNEYWYLNNGILSKDDAEEISSEHPDITYNTNPARSNLYSVRSTTMDYKISRPNYNADGSYAGDYTKVDAFGIPYDNTVLDFTSSNAKELPINSKIIAVQNGTVCPNATTEKGCFASVEYRFGYNISFAFYDEEDKLIVDDMHMWNGYGGKQYDIKTARGFYLDRPAKTVIATLKDNIIPDFTFNKFNIYYQYNSSYQNDIDKLKANSIDITDRRDDSSVIKFETNYTTDKMVVANLAIEDSWSLARREKGSTDEYEDVKIYKSHGGFISFVADKGEYEYILKYETAGLNLGRSLTLIGVIAQAIVYGLYFSFGIDDKYLKSAKFDLKKQKARKLKTKKVVKNKL